MALVEILLNSSLRSPCMIPYRSLTETLKEILVGSSLRGRGRGSWEVLSCQIHSSRSRSFYDALRGPGMKILLKVFLPFLV